MHLSKLSVKNFRVFKHLDVEFHPDLNLIFGLNGQGKTSILEAVYYLSISKSFRAKNDRIVLRETEEFFDINGIFIDQEKKSNSTRIYYSKSEGKHVFINQNKLKQFSELIGFVPVILLSLEDTDLTFGAPAKRRKFLDILLSQLFPLYLNSLQKYKRCINQKNNILNSDQKIQKNEIVIWNEQIGAHGTELIQLRKKFVTFLNENISDVYRKISGKEENIKISYNSTISMDEFSDRSISEHFAALLEKNFDSEIKRKTSLVGPHRDDLVFFKDDYLFKTHGSQGENKSFLLALKFLESAYIKRISKQEPILLLDDIFGELDNKRIENLHHFIKNQGQIFITTTDDGKFKNIIKEKSSLIHIHDQQVN